MKKRSWIVLGVLAAVLLWSPEPAHAQQRTAGAVITLHRSVDGSAGTVLRSGAYHILSVVGQPIAGRLAGSSGSLWQVRHQMKAKQAAASFSVAADVPTSYALEANYPNPFNPETTIRFALPEASQVRLEVFDLLGRQVALLVDGTLEAGRHEVLFEGRTLSSGLYMYRMVSGSFEQHRTMLLVK